MEMCYEGTLAMPSNYVVMDSEEMTYVEGGGTLTVDLNKAAVSKIMNAVADTAYATVAAALCPASWGAVLTLGVACLVSSFLIDYFGCPRAIKKSWTGDWLPTIKLRWHA